MNKSTQHSMIHFILLMSTSIGLLNHVIIIPALASVAKRDAWISVICSFIVFLIIIFIYLYIMRTTHQRHIGIWLETEFGKFSLYLFYILISIYLFSSIYVTINDLANWTNTTYLTETPRIVIIGLLIALSTVLALTNIQTIIIVNSILLPFIVILGIFVATANIQYKDYSYLTPFLENGWTPITQGMIYSGTGLAELIVFILLQHQIKGKVSYFHWALSALILMGLALGPTMGAIAVFGPTAFADQRFPAYELWGLVSIGRFIEHLDFFSIYQWLSGAFVRMAVSSYLIVELIFPQDSMPRKRKMVLVVLSMIITGLALLPVSDTSFVYYLSTYYLPSSFILLLFLLLYLAVFSFIYHRRRRLSHGK